MLSKIIDSIKLLLIDSNAYLNRNILKAMIAALSKDCNPIKVECFKSSDEDNFKENNEEVKQNIEFCFNAESKANFDSLLLQNLMSPKKSELIKSHKLNNKSRAFSPLMK